MTRSTSNPIVYSRAGKEFYASPIRGTIFTLFSVVDMQKWLQSITKKEPIWKWPFIEGQYTYKPYYTPTDPSDTTLVFESRFESGNLLLAARISDQEYKLLLQDDSLTNGNTQC